MSPLSGVLGESWGLYRRHAPHFLVIAFAVYLVIAAVSALLALALGRFGGFLGGVLGVAAMYLLQAALVKAVDDVRDGRADLDVTATLRAALPSAAPVAVASLLASIAIWIGFALLIVPGLILATFLSLVVPCIVLGGTAALPALGHSWRMVAGDGWHVFGTYVVVFLALILADVVIGAVVAAFAPTAAANFVAEIVSGTLITPFIAVVVTLVYYRLSRKSG